MITARSNHNLILAKVKSAKLASSLLEVGRATMRCHSEHGCGMAPFESAGVVSVLAATVANDGRILELGTALGYSTLWLAQGAKLAKIDTIESDPVHAAKARENFAKFELGGRITLHEGDFSEVLPTLQEGYDLIFFDGWQPCMMDEYERLLRKGGMLITSNMMYAVSWNAADAYRDRLFGAGWYSSFIDGGNTVISLRL